MGPGWKVGQTAQRELCSMPKNAGITDKNNQGHLSSFDMSLQPSIFPGQQGQQLPEPQLRVQR